MKKLFSMAIIFMVAFTLSACTNQGESQEEVYDNEITVTLEDEYGVLTSQSIGFNDDYDGELYDLINENLDVDATSTEAGIFINSIEHLTPQTGSYVSLWKNDVQSMQGIDSIGYEDNDVIQFKVIWWDETLQAIHEAIQLFIAEQASTYVSASSIDYTVLLGLELLGKETEFITQQEIMSYVDTLTLDTTQDYFKAIMMKLVAEEDIQTDLAALSEVISIGPYGQTAYGLLAINSTDHTVDFSTFETNALSDLDTTTPYDLGLDAGGISLVALSEYPDQNSLITEFASWIQTSQLETGGVQTRDTEWDGTTYPGIENAASISQVIMGLVANDIDPNGVTYTQEENTLVTRLLEFQTETGSFDYDLTDDLDEDLIFSTPQAFLALVVYQTYANTLEPVNPYTFQ